MPPRPQGICPHPHTPPQETVITLGDTKERGPEQEVLIRKQVKFTWWLSQMYSKEQKLQVRKP